MSPEELQVFIDILKGTYVHFTNMNNFTKVNVNQKT